MEKLRLNRFEKVIFGITALVVIANIPFAIWAYSPSPDIATTRQIVQAVEIELRSETMLTGTPNPSEFDSH